MGCMLHQRAHLDAVQNKHITIASLLTCGASEGVFAGMDGFVFVLERLYYGKQGFKQRKKKLRRKQAAQVLCR